MIVPMKKVHIIVRDKDAESSLEKLQELGVMHLEHQNVLSGGNIASLKEDIQLLEKATMLLYHNKDHVEQQDLEGEWKEKAHALCEIVKENDLLKEDLMKRQLTIDRLEPWGNFDPKELKALSQKDVFVALYELPRKEKKNIPEGVILEEIFCKGSECFCAVVSRTELKLPYKKIDIPSVSLEDLKKAQEDEKQKIQQNENKLKEDVKYFDFFCKILKGLKEQLLFEEAKVGMKQEEALALLKGYCPEDGCEKLQAQAKKQGWGILIEDPKDEDRVPTLLKNPKWVELLQPVLKMINILPGYKELDMSPVFLLFFTFFVGILIGDAGYGILLAAIFGGVHFVSRKKIQDPKFFYLAYAMCCCTVIWGVLTGTYFGQSWLPKTVKPVLPWLVDVKNIQLFCFFVGAVHLSVAHIWRAMVRFPSVSFLAEAGWLSLIWFMFFGAKLFVLGLEFPAGSWFLLYVGAAGVILFTKPSKNPLKAIGPGLGDLALNIINSFTDVVSYIRLFAVGLATVAVADAANEMSLFWILFLHALNLVLAALAILVHGLRLNVLEFSGHLGLEWSGIKYSPFKKAEVPS